MKNIIALSAMLTVLFATFPSSVDAEEMPKHDGSAELQRIKTLAGTWTGSVDHGSGPEPVTIVYRVTGGGSAVVETFNPDTPMEMVTVYHDRSGKLEMTHYCMLGNQPHMKMTESSDKSVSLKLADQTGVGDDKMYMSALTIEFQSDKKITQHWSMNMNGKTQKGPAIELTNKP